MKSIDGLSANSLLLLRIDVNGVSHYKIKIYQLICNQTTLMVSRMEDHIIFALLSARAQHAPNIILHQK